MSLSPIALEDYAFSHAHCIFPWYARTLALGVSLFAFTNGMRASFCLLTAADQSFCAAGSLITTAKSAPERACQGLIAENKTRRQGVCPREESRRLCAILPDDTAQPSGDIKKSD